MLLVVIEATVTLVMAYLILANADSFARAVQAASQGYIGAVRTLQGR